MPKLLPQPVAEPSYDSAALSSPRWHQSSERRELSELFITADRTGQSPHVELTDLAHKRLYRMAARIVGRNGLRQTLGPTALVNEGFARMFSSGQFHGVDSESHFYARFALCMKHALVDYFRAKNSSKRLGNKDARLASEKSKGRHAAHRIANQLQMNSAISLIDIADALEVLSMESPVAERAAKVFELRFYGAMKISELKELLGVSRSTIEADLRYAKAYILDQLLSD